MLKSKPITKNDLLDLFSNINELENRKIVYQNAINKVNQEIKEAGEYSWYQYPKSPKTPPCLQLSDIFSIFIGYGMTFGIVAIILVGIAAGIATKVTNSSFLSAWSKELENTIFIIIVSIVILLSIALTAKSVISRKKAYKNELEEHREACDNVTTYNRKQKKEAEETVIRLQSERKPDIEEWKCFISQIDKRLKYLYNVGSIPNSYQNAMAMSFFVSYLQNERCDTLKECMNKYDEDVIYYQLKGEIADIYDRICQMEQRLTRELNEFRSSIESSIKSTQILVEKNSSEIERLSYNQKTGNLLTTALLFEKY